MACIKMVDMFGGRCKLYVVVGFAMHCVLPAGPAFKSHQRLQPSLLVTTWEERYVPLLFGHGQHMERFAGIRFST